MSRNHRRLYMPRWRALRRRILGAANWRCASCGHYANEVDHVIPLHRGGDPWDAENLQALCGGRGGCHARKTARENRREPTPEETAWRELLRTL